MSRRKMSFIANFFICIMLLGLAFTAFNGGSYLTAGTTDSNKPYYRGDTTKPQVSLMINVYWGTEYISDILKVFEKFGYKTTFFVGGTWAENNYETLKLIADSGHEIGNHGYFHKNHKNLSKEVNFDEINMTNKLVKNYINVDIELFAPPSGSFSNTTLAVAKELGMKTIMWSRDTIDWRDKDENLTYSRATKDIKNGELILSHPTKHTLSALPKILQYYKDNGFSCVPVSENIGLTKV